MGGRKPKPTAVKRLTGNPGKRPLPAEGEEPDPGTLDALPEPPDWLQELEYGRREWYSRGPTLLTMGLLTPADEMSFALYCLQVDICIKASQDIQKNGQTIRGARGEVRNPALASLASATTAATKLAAEFGLTPSSRGRMKLPGDDGEDFAALLADLGEEDAE